MTRHLDGVARRLEAVLGRRVARDFPLSRCTTYRLGGPAAVFVEVASVTELVAVGTVLRETATPVLVVGRGSNLLVADRGFPGVALRLTGEFERLAVGEGRVDAGGAVALPVLARRAAAAGCAGLEFYVGIPGSVGGAVRMNAGGHGQHTAGVLDRVRVVDLDHPERGEDEREASSLALAYRHSALGPHQVVTGATFAVGADDPARCEARIDEVVRWRRENQPGGSNAGSVFKNPPGDAAGRLIDATGLKGYRVGGAVVSPKHANFFQAEPGARADDVYRLMLDVRRRVEEATGVRLVPELRLVGFDECR